jgi:hypothetical protein
MYAGEENINVKNTTTKLTKAKNINPSILYEDDLFLLDLKITICIFLKFY